MSMRKRLRRLLELERPLVMPDAYDGMSARLIALAGFKAVQCSDFSMALTSRAVPEAKLGLEKNLEITRNIVASVELPVMADGEDGFGPPTAVADVVRSFVAAGVAGINIEDQVLPPTEPGQIVDCAVMIQKIRVARKTAGQCGAPDLVVNARTDALMTSTDRAKGLQLAVERGNQYLAAGADLVFVVGVAKPEEARYVADQIRGPVSIAAGMPYNIKELSIGTLRECGVARVSFPSLAVFAALRAVKDALAMIRGAHDFDQLADRGLLCEMQDVRQVCGR